MISRVLTLTLVLLLGGCGTNLDHAVESLVQGPKSPLCQPESYPPYANGTARGVPLLCSSSVVNLLVAEPGERVYRTIWRGGGELDGMGAIEVLVRADGSGWAGPSRRERRPVPNGAFLVESVGPTGRVELTREQVAAFENAFAATGFQTAPILSDAGLYNCIHGDEMSAETLIDGVWHGIVRENCGQDSALARRLWNLLARAGRETP